MGRNIINIGRTNISTFENFTGKCVEKNFKEPRIGKYAEQYYEHRNLWEN